MNQKVNNQEMYFNIMTKLIDEIRYTRLATGNDSKHHNEIWKKIDKYYDKLNYSYQEAFNQYVK
jgi:hypothetical protein